MRKGTEGLRKGTGGLRKRTGDMRKGMRGMRKGTGGLRKAELSRRKHFHVLASPMRKHFDDAKREDTSLLKTTQSRKTRQVTDAKFRITGVSDIS